MAVRVGFASIDGNIIDQHFGHARYWQVYDIYEDDAEFVEVRKSYPACNGHCEGGF
ncbi:MAG: diguanylate cyclase, partial [Lachnospiraceae bacterium]|nr:diguanylate cyclase [Lachnospiraceae bacterium]